MPRKKAEEATQMLEQTPAEPVMATQIVRLEPPAIMLPVPPTPEEIVKLAADQIYIFKQYLKLFAREIKPEQVLLFGDQIYLPARACQTLLGYARLRLKIHSPIVQHRFNSPDGEFIVFEAHATICTREGVELDDVVASQSTRDEFFGISGKDYVCPECKGPTTRRKANANDKWDSSFCVTHGKVKAEAVTHYLPLYDVAIDDVLKKTTTNIFNRALQAIGMMPRIEDLQDAGMDISKVKRIGFKDNKQAPQQTPQRQESATPPKSNTPPAPTPPQSAPAARSTTGPPRASIPPMDGAPQSAPGTIRGTLEEVRPGTTTPKDKATGQPTGAQGRPFLSLIINGAKVTCFDNKQLALDTRGATRHAFVLLAQAVGHEVELQVKQSGQYQNVVGFNRIADHEWDEAGVPVLRRDAPPPDGAFGEQFVADDSDIPF